MVNYFLEIKNRLLLLLITWISIIFVGFVYKETLLFVFVKPTFYNSFINSPVFNYFIYTNISEIFTAFFQLIIFMANQIFFACFFYHILVFVTPGLYLFEYNYLKSIFRLGLFFWFISFFALNYFLLPASFYFFFGFQESFKNKIISFYFEAKLTEYFQFYMSLYYICALNFQVFTILIVFLEYINISSTVVKNLRKFLYFFFVIFATLITPPDVFSQICLSLVVIIIYECLLICIFLKIQMKK